MSFIKNSIFGTFRDPWGGIPKLLCDVLVAVVFGLENPTFGQK